ncbi:MAG: transglycosylase SLT domain-containing protein, partial [Hyphomicrobiales bacterium]
SASGKPASASGKPASASGKPPLTTRKPADLDFSPFPGKPAYRAFAAAIALAVKGDFAKARARVEAAGDAASIKIINWYFIRTVGSGASYQQIISFIDANPGWPGLRPARKHAEVVLYQGGAEAPVTVTYFTRFPPITRWGRIALATAYQSTGKADKARKFFRKVWSRDPLDAKSEKLVRARCPSCISTAVEKQRLDAMLYLALKKPAMRAAKRLGADYVKLAQARLAISRRSKKAERAYGKVPKNKRGNIGLIYSRISWLRRKGYQDEALKLLGSVPGNASNLTFRAKWWTERRLVARAVISGQAAIRNAYAVSADHGWTKGARFAEAEFLAGWIAFSRLKDPKLALPHFQRLEAAVKNPISRARANYWLARAYSAIGDQETARKHYTAAAEYAATYYGQLARAWLGGTLTLMDLPATPGPTPRAQKRFQSRELVAMARRLAVGGHVRLASMFVSKLAQTIESPSELSILARFANQLTLANVAVYVGKRAVRKGAPLYEISYPVGTFVDMNLAPNKPGKPVVELAMLYGIARQESEFNWRALSRVGARGLMQIMPATAKMVARDHAYPFALKRLTEDPVYSARLGSAFLSDLLDQFGGSYVLTIAAYNAGPGRVGQWIKRFGDPRSAQVDPIDWVESIPFDETRNYVQRVLENIQVYRMFLAGRPTPIRLAEDLSRGSTKQ